MSGKKKDRLGPSPETAPGAHAGPSEPGYALGWSKEHRWNPYYNVPRNSAESASSPYPSASRLEQGLERGHHASSKQSNPNPRTQSQASGTSDAADESYGQDGGKQGLADLSHWLETLGELYMNDLDNRARWDPRWLNITRQSRFAGVTSASITIVDYLADSDDSAPARESITTTQHLAATLQARPANSEVRVIMVSDLSRFVMGALGQLFSVDPEFWFEYLVNSGYAGGDYALKVKNTPWMNWAARETHFRHRALPGPGQRTEWNLPRRAKKRSWAHLRWGRLGLLNYLGRKGFHDGEIEKRLRDGRWVMEQDAVLDKRGLFMTAKRRELAEKVAKKRAKERKKKEKKNKNMMQGPQPRAVPEDPSSTSTRRKMSNVYRPYSTFDSLPTTPEHWQNRDLRVMAPEGASYWHGLDSEGKKTGRRIDPLYVPLTKGKCTRPWLTSTP